MGRVVVIFAFDGALALDVAGPAEVFAMANRSGVPEARRYELKIVSLDGGPISTASGVTLLTEKIGSIQSVDTLIVSGGSEIQSIASEPRTVNWVRETSKRSRRVCSVCTGSFILAEAGLLNGRRAATHWGSGAAFRERYPLVELDLEPIYIRDGPVWTSAGVTAGIDLALALAEDDLGQAMAINIAKQLVVFLHRPGGQAQFSSTLNAQSKAVDRGLPKRFKDLHAWMAENLAADLSVPSLAHQVNMSPRSFARIYAGAIGTTPAKFVEELRLEAAKRNLEEGFESVKEVAAGCGFGNEERLRRSFTRRYSVAPSVYRERFGTTDLTS